MSSGVPTAFRPLNTVDSGPSVSVDANPSAERDVVGATAPNLPVDTIQSAAHTPSRTGFKSAQLSPRDDEPFRSARDVDDNSSGPFPLRHSQSLLQDPSPAYFTRVSLENGNDADLDSKYSKLVKTPLKRHNSDSALHLKPAAAMASDAIYYQNYVASMGSLPMLSNSNLSSTRAAQRTPYFPLGSLIQHTLTCLLLFMSLLACC